MREERTFSQDLSQANKEMCVFEPYTKAHESTSLRTLKCPVHGPKMLYGVL